MVPAATGAAVVLFLVTVSVLVVVPLAVSVVVAAATRRAGRVNRQEVELLANMVLVHVVLKQAQDPDPE